MFRRQFLAILAATSFAPLAARAEATRLQADEIEALLSGKRITGDWNGTPYSQRFDASGMTLYTPRGGSTDPGRWRVNAEAGTYESFWERSGWSTYWIEREAGVLYWVDEAGDRYPFEVVE